MLDKLIEVDQRYQKLTHLLGQSEIVNNHKKYTQLSKEHSELEDIVKVYRDFLKVNSELEYNKSILNDKNEDAELQEIAEEEVTSLQKNQNY